MTSPSAGALLVLLLAASAHAAPNRIERVIDEPRVVLAGNTSPMAKRAVQAEPVEGSLRLGASLVFAPAPAQAAEIEALLARQRDPGSTDYRRWITPDEYAQRFGLSDADLAQVSTWLRTHGLAVTRVARSHQRLDFTGTVAQLEETFRVRLHRFDADDGRHFASTAEPSIPSALAGIVLRVGGLDDFGPHTSAGNLRRYTTPTEHALAPEDFATIYDLQALYAQGIDGTGVTLAIVGRTAYSASDIATFRMLSGLPTANIEDVFVPNSGDPSFTGPDSDIEECELDLEWSGAVARNAKIRYVYTGGAMGYDVPDALDYAVSESLANIVSYSYALCETLTSSTDIQYLDNVITEAALQGMSVVAASGDTGAAACDRGLAQLGLAVNFPASDPQVVAAGGTELSEGAGDYWNPTPDANSGSALSYIPEGAWNDTEISLEEGGGLSSGGGGVSSAFAKPTWQANDGTKSSGRDVPDIALNASPYHDGYLVCEGGCSQQWQDDLGNLEVIGGTSAASPTFAGILSLVFQQPANNTCPIGWNDTTSQLYALAASSPDAFHDITSGSNIVPCAYESEDCPGAPPYQLGYKAGPGYDQVTGLGSIDGFNLWQATRTPTSTTLASSARSVGSGGTVTLTATVTTTGTCAPLSGSVRFTSGTKTLGTATLALAEGGSQQASATLAVSHLLVGEDQLIAKYSGDQTYHGSVSATVDVDVSGCASANGDVLAMLVLVMLVRFRFQRTRNGGC